MKEIMRIDMHAHILPEFLPDWRNQFGFGEFIQLAHNRKTNTADMFLGDIFFRRIESNCWNIVDVEHEMMLNNIAGMVLCTVPVMFNYHIEGRLGLIISQFLNDHIANIQHNNPLKFKALGTLPMQETDLALKELLRCKEELGLIGIQIGSHINSPKGWINLNDSSIFPVFEAAQELEMAVFIHPWDMMGGVNMKRYWLPWLIGMPAETTLAICSMIFGGVFERLKKLRVCFAHAGGSFVGTFGRIEHGFNVRPDLVAIDNNVSPRDYLGRFWVDSHSCDPGMLHKAINLFGKDKICFGSDYPFPLGEWHNGKWSPGNMLDSLMNLEDRTKRMIFKENIESWLGIKWIK